MSWVAVAKKIPGVNKSMLLSFFCEEELQFLTGTVHHFPRKLKQSKLLTHDDLQTLQLSFQCRSVEGSQCDWEADRTKLLTDRHWGHPPQTDQTNILNQSYQTKGTEHNAVNTHKALCFFYLRSKKRPFVYHYSWKTSHKITLCSNPTNAITLTDEITDFSKVMAFQFWEN